jgi:hypothetical protein
LPAFAQHEKCSLSLRDDLEDSSIGLGAGARGFRLRRPPPMTSDAGEWNTLFDRDTPVVSTAAFLIHHVKWIVVNRRRDHGVFERANDRRALSQSTGTRLRCDYFATVAKSVLSNPFESQS